MDFDPKTHFPRKAGFGDTALSVPDLQAEIARLTRENAHLRQIERNVQAAREHEYKRAERALAERDTIEAKAEARGMRKAASRCRELREGVASGEYHLGVMDCVSAILALAEEREAEATRNREG